MTQPTVALLTSGGDAPGMNAAIAAVVKSMAALGGSVVGIQDGYDGLIDGTQRPLRPMDVDQLPREGGTELRSARSARFLTQAGRAAAAKNLAGFDALIVIGGNGSIAGANLLSKEHGVQVVCIPASIDNDIGCTSLSIGVDTALNTITEACDRISDTARSHRRAFIVEVMGRQCGYLAMASAISCMADAVLVREQGKSEDQLVAELGDVVRQAYSSSRNKRRVLIIKAEGVAVPTASLAARLEQTLQEDCGGATLRFTVLGHVIRGGRPSFMDRMIASRLGHAASHAVAMGHSRVMVGWRADETGHLPFPLDPRVQLFDLDTVLRHTSDLLDGTHPTSEARVALLAKAQGILTL
jgi:6-phosphofructokinase 1